MRLEERLREILQASSGHYKVGLNILTVDFDKLEDGTIKEGSINYEVKHYPRVEIENPAKSWTPTQNAHVNDAFMDILKSIQCVPQIIEEMGKNQKSNLNAPKDEDDHICEGGLPF